MSANGLNTTRMFVCVKKKGGRPSVIYGRVVAKFKTVICRRQEIINQHELISSLNSQSDGQVTQDDRSYWFEHQLERVDGNAIAFATQSRQNAVCRCHRFRHLLFAHTPHQSNQVFLFTSTYGLHQENNTPYNH